MAKKRNWERVTAEITLLHLILLANAHGYRVSHEQALAFLNEKAGAQEIWKQMQSRQPRIGAGSGRVVSTVGSAVGGCG